MRQCENVLSHISRAYMEFKASIRPRFARGECEPSSPYSHSNQATTLTCPPFDRVYIEGTECPSGSYLPSSPCNTTTCTVVVEVLSDIVDSSETSVLLTHDIE